MLLAGGVGLALPAGAFAAEKPLFGGTFVVGAATEPRIIHPGVTTDVYSNLILTSIYSKLVNIDQEFNFLPELAKSWTVSEDGKIFTFKLEPNVKWHDGKPFTSADVVFSFEKVHGVHHPLGQSTMKYVEKFEAPDAQTVIITLKSVYAPFMLYLGRNGQIVPKHVFETVDITKLSADFVPVGTGPFRFKEWKRGSHIAMERNRDYFRKDEPYLDGVQVKFLPDPSSRMIALESGDIDYIPAYDLPASAVRRLQASKSITVTSKGHESWADIVELMFNLDKAPYNNLKVRQAIAHAIDRNFIVDKATFNLTKVATGPISSETGWAYTADVPKYAYDPDLAAKLLDEAGVTKGADGTRFEARLVVQRGVDTFLRASEIIAEQLKRVGIAVKIQVLDKSTALEVVYSKRDFDVFLASLASGPDPALGVQRQYITSNIRPAPFTNAAGYRNEEVDKLFQEAAATNDRTIRADRYKKTQQVLVRDLPVLWLFEVVTYSAYRNEFAGLNSWSPDSIYYYDKAWWTKGKASRA